MMSDDEWPACGHHVVIIGGGIIGCSIAYYLTKRGVNYVTIVERHEIAGCASGTAGGLLSRVWNDNKGPLKQLTKESYKLHEELGKEFDVDYRMVDVKSVDYTVREGVASEACQSKEVATPTWLDGKRPPEQVGFLGDTSNFAQVHPRKLTKALCTGACSQGATVVTEMVTGLKFSSDRKVVKHVKLASGKTLSCDSVVIAMGPWSQKASDWLGGLPRVINQKAHSILLRPKTELPAEGIFLTWPEAHRANAEIIPRPDGNVFMSAFATDETLPCDPADVTGNPERWEQMHDIANRISLALRDSEKLENRACFLPISPGNDGDMPMIGLIPDTSNAFVATGHGCWGILNGPATGCALAELMVTRKSTRVDLSSFAVSNFME